MRITTVAATLAIALGALLSPPPALAQEPQPEPPRDPRKLDERKRTFMDGFTRRLAETQKEETSPEREEIMRLEELKKDYKSKLDVTEQSLERSASVVTDSFKNLVTRGKTRDEVEQRCEGIWLTYLRQSRDYKSAMFEYTTALKGLDRRITFIKQREVERELPGLDYQKYYTADDIEVYNESEGVDIDVLGPQKTHVSYYALLKDFVLQMSGGGRADDRVIEANLEEPALIRAWSRWKKNLQGDR